MKKEYWRLFCEEIGKSTPVEEVWSMIKKMSGIRREYDYPVLSTGAEIAVCDKDKAEMFRNELSKVNSSGNLTKESKDMREKLLIEYPYIREKRELLLAH